MVPGRITRARTREEFWGLGSQLWSRNPHVAGYNARFGILLDMVGGVESTFYYEGYSQQYAPEVNRKVWQAAADAGYGTSSCHSRAVT